MPKRILKGTVVSDKADKTITVLVGRRVKDKLYQKVVKKSSKFTAHDENNQFKTGDIVEIQECRPISKTKTWTVLNGQDDVKKTEAKKPAAKKAPVKEEKKKVEAKKPAAKKTVAKKTETKKPAAKKATSKDNKEE